MFAVFATLFCLMAVSHSAPLDCEDLVQPFNQLDPHHLQGRWALVAGSLNDSAAADALKGRDSIVFDVHNTTFTQAHRAGDQCQYDSLNSSLEDHTLKVMGKSLNFTGTFFSTSCSDCLVFRLDMEAMNYESADVYLFSRRREVEQDEMEKFKGQVECLNMPPPVIMDPTKELCPEQTTSEPAAEEKTEGQKA